MNQHNDNSITIVVLVFNYCQRPYHCHQCASFISSVMYTFGPSVSLYYLVCKAILCYTSITFVGDLHKPCLYLCLIKEESSDA